MFVVQVHYVKPISEVDAHLEAHRRFLEKQYAKGVFIASGPRVPRTGGIIIARAASKEALEQIIDEDPFYLNGVATYEIMEFVARMVAPELASMVERI